ncbi:MAG: DUF4872 domain-containing protein [Caldilineaceae bacterium]|nr:DUF4872 domain-containing protein [Caldilineaceae bacterium]MDE0340297.1 DUF4872 domain-containing protein [Caldilineaceae bacterium]
MPTLTDYAQFEGLHWETGTVRNYYDYCGVKAPHTGKPYSEALLMGISGGAVMGYFVFAYQGIDPHARILTRNTFDPMETMLQRLGSVQDLRQTASAEKAVSNLVDTLQEGTPAVTWVDAFSLPYDPQPYEFEIPHMLPVVVFGYDEEANQVAIADRARVPLFATTSQLAAARSKVKKFRHRIMTLGKPDVDQIPVAVEAGIQDSIQLYTEKPPKGARHNFGFAAYQRWADALRKPKMRGSWDKEFPRGRKMYAGMESVFSDTHTYGKEGFAERDVFAAFLDEAAQILGRPGLEEAAAHFRASGLAWRVLGELLLPDEVSVWGEARRLMLENQQLFLVQGGESFEEGQANAERLIAIRSEMEKEFPLTEEEVVAFRESVAEQVLKISAVEELAVAAMKEAMA